MCYLSLFLSLPAFKINPAIITYKKPCIPICSIHPLNNPTKLANVKAKAFSSFTEAKIQTNQKHFTYDNYDHKDNIMLVISNFFLGTLFVPFIGYSLLFFLLQCTRRKNQVKSPSSESLPKNVSGPDVIVVGAGVAGSALAYSLGKDGRKVHVIERDLSEPDRIVGELLQPGGYLSLVELDLQDCVEEIDAQRVLGLAVYKNGKSAKLPYPLEKFPSDVSGRCFHNGRFIQRMRGKAATLPTVQLEQGTVTSLIEENGTVKGVQYKTKVGEELRAYAPLTIVCDGHFSNLRRSLCKPKIEVPSCSVALIIKNCNLPFPNHGHIIIADSAPIVFYPISSTEIRCMVEIPGQKLLPIANGEMANYLRTVVAPQIPPELHDDFISAVNEGNIRTMPNRIMPADPKHTPGTLMLGDALNTRHPLTGSGMMVALSDVVILRDLLKQVRDLKNASSIRGCIESFYILRKPVASTINIIAGVAHKVFSSSSDAAQQEMQQFCFDYICLVKNFSSEHIALASGLSTRPLNLVLNSFALAAYGAGHLLAPFPSPERLLQRARLILNASAILFPLLQAEGVTQILFPARTPSLS